MKTLKKAVGVFLPALAVLILPFVCGAVFAQTATDGIAGRLRDADLQGAHRWRFVVERSGAPDRAGRILEADVDAADPGRQRVYIKANVGTGFEMIALIFGGEALVLSEPAGDWIKAPLDEVGFQSVGLAAFLGDLLAASQLAPVDGDAAAEFGGPGEGETLQEISAGQAAIANFSFRDVRGVLATADDGEFRRLNLKAGADLPGEEGVPVRVELFFDEAESVFLSYGYWAGVAEAFRAYDEGDLASSAALLNELHYEFGVRLPDLKLSVGNSEELIGLAARCIARADWQTLDRIMDGASLSKSDGPKHKRYKALFGRSLGEETVLGRLDPVDGETLFRVSYKKDSGETQTARFRCVRRQDGQWRIAEAAAEPPGGAREPETTDASAEGDGHRSYEGSAAEWQKLESPDERPTGSEEAGGEGSDRHSLAWPFGDEKKSGAPPAPRIVPETAPDQGLRGPGAAAEAEEYPTMVFDEAIEDEFDLIEKAIEAYRQKNGALPTGVADLIRDQDISLVNCLDPWENYFVIEHAGQEASLITYGADGKPGGSGEARDRRRQLKAD